MDQSYPKTIEGAFQFLQDLADDYAAHVHDGTSTRQFDTIRANGASIRALSIQKVGYGDTTPGLWTGVVNGLPQFYLGTASKYIKFDGVNFSILGALSVTSIDIPDTTTSNSFHVDSSGNAWWGANVAAGISSANAAITSAGAATFKNVAVGGNAVQYIITNSGIFSYGDGSDGAAAFDGSHAVTGASRSSTTYTLTRDVYYTTATVSDGVDVITAGYRIFCSVSLTVGGGTSGKIHWDGVAGGNGTSGAAGSNTNNVTGGAGGTALADGYLKGSKAAGAGGNGGFSTQNPPGNSTVGGDGVSTTNSLGNAASSGGVGGNSGHALSSEQIGSVAGSAGGISIALVKLIANWHLATLLDITATGATIKFDNSGSASGGGGGAAGNAAGGLGGAANQGGAGGGGGSAGGILAIYAKSIIINSGGLITSNGGKGGNGGKGADGNVTWPDAGGGGGGGGGGNGGIIVLTYNSLTNSGSITATAGAAGTAGVAGAGFGGGTANGQAGGTGPAGSAGTIYQFQLSL